MYKSEPYIWSAVLALIGGGLTYASKATHGRGKFKVGGFLIACANAAIIGYLVCMGAHAYGLSFEACGALAGFSGLVSEEATAIGLQYVKRILGLQ